MRKKDGADGQRAKVMENFTTESASEERMLQKLMQFVAASVTMRASQERDSENLVSRVSNLHYVYTNRRMYVLM